MIEPVFTEGLPPAGVEGLCLACDGDGKLWLLRWAPERTCFAALGWPTDGSNPEQRYVDGSYPGWSIAGHQPVVWESPAPPEDAEWGEVPPEGPLGLTGPES